ncbi:MAG: magnesium transporter CorA [Lachnospiraceae bacterium]|nr:magnesium transporter CorA [Lachnospiraceae bacterium]
MYYKIGEKIEEFEPVTFDDLDFQYIAVIGSAEWVDSYQKFDMGIEWDININEITNTRATVNYDSLTGTFSVPSREDISGRRHKFAFALDERGIVFIDDEGFASRVIEKIAKTKKYINPCLEKFLYDFLESIIYRDYQIIEQYDSRLDEMEADILNGEPNQSIKKLSDIRSDLRDIRIHYVQLMDFCQELEENENEFFSVDNERYFRLVSQRIQTLYEMTISLSDYTTHIRELYQAQLDIKQNRIMTLLTIITSIFMPLTLIAGWYGMNFVYMPELKSPWGYPAVIVISILIVIASLSYFKHKKWL